MNAKSSKRRNIRRSSQFFGISADFPKILAETRRVTSSEHAFSQSAAKRSPLPRASLGKTAQNYFVQLRFRQLKTKSTKTPRKSQSQILEKRLSEIERFCLRQSPKKTR